MFDKQTFDKKDGVSPVIGVILMVAITVILAAVIGTFVLDLAGGLSQDAQASVTFDEDAGNSLTVQLVSMQNADEVRVQDPGGGDAVVLDSVGASYTTGTSGDTPSGGNNTIAYSTDETYTVTGHLEGNSTVLQTYET